MLEGSVVTVQGKGTETNGTGGLGGPGADVGIGRRGPSSARQFSLTSYDLSNRLTCGSLFAPRHLQHETKTTMLTRATFFLSCLAPS
jgi:hypothetical protein